MRPSLGKSYLIQTKLHRPQLPRDVVERHDKGCFYDADSRQPLTLVCAPAGYGKSTLVAQWAEAADLPTAWFSVDENDSDLRTFLDYMVATINRVFPGACDEVFEMLSADTLPPVEVVAARLSNDLDTIDERFILVLDDFHRLSDSDVQRVLDRVLAYPPRGMQLVIATRRNPSLSLHSMRGHNALREVRLRDLQFTEEETAHFLERASNKTLNTKTIRKIHDETEGWPVALRLAALAIRHHTDPNVFIEGFPGGTLRLEEFLLTEVLYQQPAEIRSCLLRSSILGRLCAPLCDAVCDPRAESQQSGSRGELLIRALREAPMPCVPLDEVHEWYRLHHLFQEMLARHLANEVGADEIADLHRRAAHWLDEHELVDEALHHYLQAGDAQQAARVVARHRQKAVNAEQWFLVAKWLGALPQDVVQNDAGLLMLLARLSEKQGRYATSVETMDRAEAVLSDPKHGGPDHDLYQGWLDQQRSIFAYHFRQPEEAIKLAIRALESLPEECESERVYAKLSLAVSYQMTGEAQKGLNVVYDGLEREGKASATAHSRLLQTLCWIHWLEGDLRALEQAAGSLLDVGRRSGYRETVVHGQYFLGAARYHLNQLDTAKESLTPPASDPFGPVFIMYMSASLALSLLSQVEGGPLQARETVDALLAHMLETGNTSHLAYAQAQQAEIAMRKGRYAEALHWAERFETGQVMAGYQFTFPDFTAAKILIQQGDASHLARTDALLKNLQAHVEATHNTRFTIEALGLRSLFESKRGEDDLAVELLTQAVEMAQPLGFVRLFVDLGAAISPILNRVRVGEESLRYIGEIHAAFGVRASAGYAVVGEAPSSKVDSRDTLSKRELEVLGLLARQLTNREIGGELFISPETVKRHTKNIYQKLSVSSRREAVAKASGLGILRST